MMRRLIQGGGDGGVLVLAVEAVATAQQVPQADGAGSATSLKSG